jgi:hypothetical protein
VSYLGSAVLWYDLINPDGKVMTGDSIPNYFTELMNFLLHYGLGDNIYYKEEFINSHYDVTAPADAAGYRALYSRVWYVKDGYLVSPSTPDATTYSFQTVISTVLQLVFGMDSDTQKQLTNKLAKVLNYIDQTSLWMWTIGEYGYEWVTTSKKNDKAGDIWAALEKCDIESVLGTEKYNELHSMWPVLADVLLTFVSYDYSYKNQNLVGTLAYNASTIATQHYPEVNFAWMRAQDDLYQDDWEGFSTDPYDLAAAEADSLKAPSASGSGKTYYTAQKIQMTELTPGASIVYSISTDGSKNATPTVGDEKSKVYGGYIGLNAGFGETTTYTISARAYHNGYYSDTVYYTYTIKNSAKKYKVTIQDGSTTQTASYYCGETVVLSSSDTDTDTFNKWTTANTDIEIADTSSATTSFIMPVGDVTIKTDRIKRFNDVRLQFNGSGTSSPDYEMYIDSDKTILSNTVNWYVSNGTSSYKSSGYVGETDECVSSDGEPAAVQWSNGDTSSYLAYRKATVILPKIVNNDGTKAPSFGKLIGNSYKVDASTEPLENRKYAATLDPDGTLYMKMEFELPNLINTISIPGSVTIDHVYGSSVTMDDVIAAVKKKNIYATINKNYNISASAPLVYSAVEGSNYDSSKTGEQTITLNASIDLEESNFINPNNVDITNPIEVKILQARNLYDVTASPESEIFTDSLSKEITLQCEEGADIYYTMDGSDPKNADNQASIIKYTGPFTITGTQGRKTDYTINAYAKKDGYLDSNTKTFAYTFNQDAGTKHAINLKNGYAVLAEKFNTTITESYSYKSIIIRPKDLPAGTTFKQWNVNNDSVELLRAKDVSANIFVMPAGIADLTAEYSVANLNLTVSSPFETGGPSVTSVKNGSDASIANGTATIKDLDTSDNTYTAEITVPLTAGEACYADGVAAKVNGNNAVVQRVSDTEVKVIYQFAKEGVTKYKVTVTNQDESKNNTTIGTPLSFDYAEGTTVSIPVSILHNYDFRNWSMNGGNQSTDSTVAFPMPASDVSITVKYTPYGTSIDKAIIKLSAPTVQKDLPTDAQPEDGSNFTVSQQWSTSGKPYYDEDCSAMITLIPNTDYYFSSSTLVESINISPLSNGSIKDKTLNTDGTISVIVSYTTAKAKLASIEYTDSGTYIHASTDDVTAAITADLPSKAILHFTDGYAEQLALTSTGWSADPQYDSATETEQSVIYTNTPELPSYVDANGISNELTYTATVKAKSIYSKPIADIKSGTYTENQSLSLTSPEGGTIYYTMDGSDPTESSTLYSSKISLNGTPGSTKNITVKAYVKSNDLYTASETTEMQYEIALPAAHTVAVTGGKSTTSADIESTSFSAGDTVKITADDPSDGKVFSGWKITAGDIVLADSTKKTTAFTMPDEDVELTAQYKTVISSYEFTADAPVQGETVDTEASVKINGNSLADHTSADIVWSPNSIVDGKADGGTSYTAKITVHLPTEEYVFADTVIGTVNGNAAEGARNDDGSITFCYRFAATEGNPTVSNYKVTVKVKTDTMLKETEYDAGNYQIGETVSLAAPAATGHNFVKWTAEKTDGTEIGTLTCNSKSLSFDMPAYDVILHANYSSNTVIASAALSMPVPAANTALSSVVSSSTEGIASVSVKWMDSSKPGYYQKRIAAVTLTPDDTHKFDKEAFTKDSITIDNGAAVSTIDFNDDGSVTAYIIYTTEKKQVTSVSWNDSETIVPEGTSSTVMKSHIAKKALLVYADGDTQAADVTVSDIEGQSMKFSCTIDQTAIPSDAEVKDGVSLTRTVAFAYDTASLEQAAAPLFSFDAGSGIITINKQYSEGTIYYTYTNVSEGDAADPADPDINSNVYSSSIQMTGEKGKTCQYKVKAYLVIDGYKSSEVASATFNYSVPYTVTVNSYDANLQKVFNSTVYQYKTGSAVTIVKPIEADEKFYGWQKEDETVDSSSSQKFTMGSTDVVLNAVFIPQVNQINIELADPIIGSSLTDSISSAFVTITNSYEIHPDDLKIEWSSADKAEYGGSYAAKITLNPDKDGKIRMRVKGTSAWTSTTPVFNMSDTVSLMINGKKSPLTSEYGSFVGYYTVTMGNAVLAAEPDVDSWFTAKYANGTAESSFVSTSNAILTLKDGNQISVPVHWTWPSGYDAKSANEQTITMTGTVELPENVENPENYNLTFQRDITISGTDKQASPVEANLSSGIYTDSTSITLKTEDENPVIHYMVTGTGFDGTEQIYDGQAILLEGSLAGEEYSIETWASADNMHDSIHRTYTYQVILNPMAPIVSDAEIKLPEQTDFAKKLDVSIPEGSSAEFSVADGYELPMGMSLSADGVLSGKPKAVGDYTFYVKAENEYGYSLAKITLHVTAIQYEFTIGNDSSHKLGSTDDLYFEINGNLDLFTGLKADGAALTEGTDYSVEEGSTKIWIKASFLNTLKVGRHELTASYRNHTEVPTAHFYINSSDSAQDEGIPDTKAGDDRLWIYMNISAMILMIGCAAVLLKDRRRS